MRWRDSSIVLHSRQVQPRVNRVITSRLAQNKPWSLRAERHWMEKYSCLSWDELSLYIQQRVARTYVAMLSNVLHVT